MNSYKCYICQNSYEDDAMLLHICYICDKIICGKCNHSHNTFVKDDDDSLKEIIKEKAQQTYDQIMSCFDFDQFGYPHNINYLYV